MKSICSMRIEELAWKVLCRGSKCSLDQHQSLLDRVFSHSGHSFVFSYPLMTLINSVLMRSATIPNINDVAEWLDGAVPFPFDESTRPVPLEIRVIGYQDGKNDYLFDNSLNYKLYDLIHQYSHAKSVLIFCSTRKQCSAAAATLAQENDRRADNILIRDYAHKADLLRAAAQFKDKSLQEQVKHGIGIHHAALCYEDRALVEQLFLEQVLPVLWFVFVCSASRCSGLRKCCSVQRQLSHKESTFLPTWLLSKELTISGEAQVWLRKL